MRWLSVANTCPTERTTLAGRVAHEVNSVPVENEEARRLLAMMTMEAMKPKFFTKFVEDDLSGNRAGFIQPGTVAGMNAFGGFIVSCHILLPLPRTNQLAQKTKGTTAASRPQLSKAARMPQNELLDRIFECFRRYNYWSMKALRAELQQPEVYLRETLEKVAVLAKSGRFATQWSLKPENKLANYEGGVDAAAPINEEESDTGMDDDEEEEDIKFEDVVPS